MSSPCDSSTDEPRVGRSADALKGFTCYQRSLAGCRPAGRDGCGGASWRVAGCLAMAKRVVNSPAESITWLDHVADHDYDAEAAYLSIKVGEEAVQKTVKTLKSSQLVHRRSNDVLRAAGLEPAPLSYPGVHKDLVKVTRRERLKPGSGGHRHPARRYRRRLPPSLAGLSARSVRHHPAQARLIPGPAFLDPGLG